ncbi:hypothetical protein CsSME_00014766 [Camellia sinensis var. sinensis]
MAEIGDKAHEIIDEPKWMNCGTSYARLGCNEKWKKERRQKYENRGKCAT